MKTYDRELNRGLTRKAMTEARKTKRAVLVPRQTASGIKHTADSSVCDPVFGLLVAGDPRYDLARVRAIIASDFHEFPIED